MAWETSLTNRREGGRNRTRDRKGSSKPEDPAHKREPLTERGFGALAEPRPVLRGLRHSSRPRTIPRAHFTLAEPRPVLRGLRRCGRAGCPPRRPSGLQSRDPFSGDCDAFASRERIMTTLPDSLQSRDPFSGDCDQATLRSARRAGRTPCRAETRSQGIATRISHLRLALVGFLAEPRPVLRGLRPVFRADNVPACRATCRAETRSQGIATEHAFSASAATSLSCRAETRSQGIAT